MNLNKLIAEIATSYRVGLETKMVEIGLHAGQVFLLLLLHENENISQAEIYKQLSLSAPTVNKMVKSLANNDFVQCRRDTKDTRMVRVSLSEKGRAVKSAIEEKFAAMDSLLLQEFSETEKIMVILLLEKMRTNLTNHKSALKNTSKKK